MAFILTSRLGTVEFMQEFEKSEKDKGHGLH